MAGDDDYLRGATSINHQVALRANFKMYSRSAKGGEKGDPNRNPWLAKMDKHEPRDILHCHVERRDQHFVVAGRAERYDQEYRLYILRHSMFNVQCDHHDKFQPRP